MVEGKLKVGDEVWHAGGWGAQPYRKTVVQAIEHTQGGKYGTSVEEADWSEVRKPRQYVVDLSSGNWAYGNQLLPANIVNPESYREVI